MGIRASHFRHLLIRPVLKHLATAESRLYSLAAENLLMGTAAQETRLGYSMHQINGPALGAFQIEIDTFEDVLDRYLKRPANEAIRLVVEGFSYRGVAVNDFRQLATNLPLSCAISRIRYWMVPESLPKAEDLPGLASYWNRHYNANDQHGTDEEFIGKYQKMVKDFS